MNKSPQSLKVKEKSAFWLSNHATKIASVLLALLILFLPTQLGKHFWPDFSLVTGIRVDYLAPTVYITDILIGLLFLVWVLRKRHPGLDRPTGMQGRGNDRIKRLFFNKKTWIVLFTLTFLLLNVFRADRIGLSLYYLLKLFEFSFLGYYIARYTRLTHLPVIALLTAVSVFFQSFLAILQYLHQGSLNGWLYFLGERTFNGSTVGIANADINGELILRPYGTFPHPNILAGYLFIGIILIGFFLHPKARGFIRVFGLLTIGLASVALMLSLSRVVIGLYIFLLLLWFGYWFIKKRPKPRMHLGFLIIAAIVDLVLFIGGLAFLQTIASRFTQTSFLEEALTQRNELMESAVTIIQAHPFLGVGLGHFIPALAPLQDPLSIGLYLQPVHNIFLLTAAETGLIGLSLFVTFLVLTYRHLLLQIRLTPLSRPTYLVLMLLLSSILIIGLFDHYFLTLQQGQLLFALVLGLCWAKVSAR